MNNMEYQQRINAKFEKGLIHGQQGIYKPGWTFGVFRCMYNQGHKQGCKMKKQIRKLTDFKIK